MKQFDEHWKEWIGRNVAEGCSKDILFKVLHDTGFAYDEIRRELDHEPTLSLSAIFSPLAASAQPPRNTSLAATDFASMLGPGESIAAPEWIQRATREQCERVPYLGAGGPECRGFEKRRLDEDVHSEIRARYEAAKGQLVPEASDAAGTYFDTVLPNLPAALLHIDPEFNRILLELLRPMHEEWCGFELEPESCFGFRVYLPGAYLHMHVDREQSHVISSTVCVDRHVYAPWPLHAEDADGRIGEIELEPGEALLYESARIVHGRPTPLNGRFHAALFLHYRPTEDWDTWKRSPMEWWAMHGGGGSRGAR